MSESQALPSALMTLAAVHDLIRGMGLAVERANGGSRQADSAAEVIQGLTHGVVQLASRVHEISATPREQNTAAGSIEQHIQSISAMSETTRNAVVGGHSRKRGDRSRDRATCRRHRALQAWITRHLSRAALLDVTVTS